MCFVCGKENEYGLKLDFEFDRENKTLSTKFIPEKKFQGFKDIIHGGIIGLVLDEVMGNLAYKLGHNAVTSELTYRLKIPAKAGEEIFFSGKILDDTKRVITAEATAKNADGKMIAVAAAKLLKV